MRASSSLALAALVTLVWAVAGCERFEPLILCHNSNCATPDVDRDDTIPALRESLALTHDGVPALDGTEFDTFWRASTNECLFAHDLDHATPVPLMDAADVVSDYLATHPRASWRGDRFYLLLDFKPNVGGAYTDGHTEEQYISHVECLFDVVYRVLEGARAGGHQLSVEYTSSVPRALEVINSRPRFAMLQAEPDLENHMVADIFTPYSSVQAELHEFGHLDAVEYHPDFMTEPLRETYRSKGIELVQWSFSSTTESFDAIEQWEPKFAITNEALLLRNWTEN